MSQSALVSLTVRELGCTGKVREKVLHDRGKITFKGGIVAGGDRTRTCIDGKQLRTGLDV